jgi:hypothetical protein
LAGAPLMISWRRKIRGGSVPAIEDIRTYQRRVLNEDRSPTEWLARGDHVLAEAAAVASEPAPQILRRVPVDLGARR